MRGPCQTPCATPAWGAWSHPTTSHPHNTNQLPQPWVTGLWSGRDTLSEELLISIAAGVMRIRAVHRLQDSARWVRVGSLHDFEVRLRRYDRTSSQIRSDRTKGKGKLKDKDADTDAKRRAWRVKDKDTPTTDPDARVICSYCHRKESPGVRLERSTLYDLNCDLRRPHTLRGKRLNLHRDAQCQAGDLEVEDQNELERACHMRRTRQLY